MGDFSKDINSTFPNNKVKATLNVLYTANWINRQQNAFFKPFGVSPQQFNILRILRGAGKPIKVQTVKERMIEQSPNTTRLMDKLIVKKLIGRAHCPDDRRVVYVEINKNGIDLLNEISKKMHIDFLKNLTENEANQLSNLLDKIR